MFDTTEVSAPPEVDWPDFDPGPGPQWSTYLPDRLLADTLERQSGEGSQWERLERISAWERVVAWAQANQLREMATFAEGAEQEAARDAAERAAARAAGESVAPEVARIDGLESAAAEISLMLRIAPVTATSRLDDALTLTGRFPAAMAALAAGRITLPKARIIAEQTEQLPDPDAAAVSERVLGRAAEQTSGQLRRSVRRAVARTDPAAVRSRHEAAKRDRGVCATTGTGPTNEHNLDPYCRRHHRTKHSEGWSVARGEHGALIWTSPSGHTWAHQPEPITEPAPKRPPPRPE